MGSKSLSERSHLDLDLVRNPDLLGQSPALPAHDAYGVGFIEEHPGSITFLEVHQFAKRAAVTIHTVDRFGDNEDFSLRMLRCGPLQMALEFCGIVVGKNSDERTAQSGRIN